MPLRACVSLSLLCSTACGLRSAALDPPLTNTSELAFDTLLQRTRDEEPSQRPQRSRRARKEPKRVPRHPTCASCQAEEPSGRRTAQPSI